MHMLVRSNGREHASHHCAHAMPVAKRVGSPLPSVDSRQLSALASCQMVHIHPNAANKGAYPPICDLLAWMLAPDCCCRLRSAAAPAPRHIMRITEGHTMTQQPKPWLTDEKRHAVLESTASTELTNASTVARRSKFVSMFPAARAGRLSAGDGDMWMWTRFDHVRSTRLYARSFHEAVTKPWIG